MRKHSTTKIYAFSFVADVAPIAALYSVMFAGVGLSTLQISVLLAAWSVAAIVFEVPSGALADRFDRRLVLFCGEIVTALGFLVWLISPDFAGYFIGFVLWGIGGACASGTFEALVYDELAERKQAERFVDVLGRSEACTLIAYVVGSLFAAYFVQAGYTMLIWTSLATSVLAAVMALSLPAARKFEEVGEDNYLGTIKRGFISAAKTPLIARCLVIIAVTGCVTDLVSEYSPLFVTDRQVAAAGVALVFAAFVLVLAAASAFAAKLPGARISPSIQLCVAGALIACASMLPTWPAIIAFNGAAIISTVCGVVIRAEMQTHIEEDIRATTTSVGGFVQEMCNVVGLIAIGLVADIFTRDTALAAAGVVLCVLSGAVALREQWRLRVNH